MWKRISFDARASLMLGGACILLYLAVAYALFLIGSAKGLPLERMLGLHLDDIREYTGLAHTMLDAHRFAISPDAPPEFFRTPGYPAFLALVFLIFRTLAVVTIIQIIFTAGAVALVYLIGVRFFSRGIATAAAVLYMADPLVTYAALTPIGESLFMLLFLASAYSISSGAKRSWLSSFTAGIFLGLAILVRPVGLYLAPFVAAMSIAYAVTWRDASQKMGIFLLALVCTLSPWIGRNYALSGHVALSSIQSFNVYYYNVPLFEQARTGRPYREIRDMLDARIGTDDERALQSFSYAGKEWSLAREMLRAHPIQYAFFHLLKSGLLLIGSSINSMSYHLYQYGIITTNPAPIGAQGMLLEGRWHDAMVQTLGNIPKLLERLFWLAAYLGALSTTMVWMLRRSARSSWVISAFLIVNAVAILAGPVSDDTRYRIPADPFIFLLGMSALYDAVAYVRTRIARSHVATM